MTSSFGIRPSVVRERARAKISARNSQPYVHRFICIMCVCFFSYHLYKRRVVCRGCCFLKFDMFLWFIFRFVYGISICFWWMFFGRFSLILHDWVYSWVGFAELSRSYRRNFATTRKVEGLDFENHAIWSEIQETSTVFFFIKFLICSIFFWARAASWSFVFNRLMGLLVKIYV